ncbi:MAG: peptidoglycan-associated lipoprotein Pal [Gammaproteobacteria bacterium]|nr:peptidoglycan-associated lipoprotein Pal [Gammaproteobacteria bacterium]
MRRVLEIILISSLLVGVTACSGLKKKGSEEQQMDSTSAGELTGGSDEANIENRVIYFDFDKSEVKTEFQQLITAHAEYIAGHPDITVVLEGHADERGTREYNIALGERRAKAVKEMLVLQGVAEKQLQVISFGEERPVALGHDESAWSLNRRVELLYSGE